MPYDAILTESRAGLKLAALLLQVREDPQALRAYGLLAGNLALGRLAATPEPQLQQGLEAAAWAFLRLDPSCSFTCTLHGSQEQGVSQQAEDGVGTAANGSGTSSSSGGNGECGFEFGGSSTDLRVLVYLLAGMQDFEEEHGFSPHAWFPSDGRIQLQRCPQQARSDSGSWLRSWNQSPAPACEGTYRLRVNAEGMHGESRRQLQREQKAAAEAPARTAVLSQTQLNTLMDCLDAFAAQHPDFVVLQLPRPLQAPQPGLLQQLSLLFSPADGGSSSPDAPPTPALPNPSLSDVASVLGNSANAGNGTFV